MLMWLVFGLAAKWTVWLSSAAAVEEVTEGCSHSLVQNRHSARTRQTGPLEDHQGCSLPLCVFHGPTAPRLWVAEQSDGAGHRMMNVVNGMAVAQKVGMNFGGVLQWEVGSEVTDQHVNFTDVAAALFGATTNDIGSLFACCRGSDPGFDFSFQGTRELEGVDGPGLRLELERQRSRLAFLPIRVPAEALSAVGIMAAALHPRQGSGGHARQAGRPRAGRPQGHAERVLLQDRRQDPRASSFSRVSCLGRHQGPKGPECLEGRRLQWIQTERHAGPFRRWGSR